VFIDKNTADTLAKQNAEILKADRVHGSEIVERLGDSIYMDAMAFGMGANCLQVTFQASDVKQARTLYDQLAVMAPIMLALTAGSPIWKGMLADTDTRWNIISASCDDRTAHERGLAEPSSQDDKLAQRIYKSRYSSIDCFIGESDLNRPEFSDVPVPLEARSMERLLDAGIDERLARHVASLFVRDPLVIYQEKLQQDESLVIFFVSLHFKLITVL
jgi:glutamate--cysteine ligase catalytic subunit